MMDRKTNHLFVRGERGNSVPGRRENGQALVIVVFGIFALLILVGLAVDLGLYYIERVRITRAVDAAALGSAYELPLEDAAHVQAGTLLLQNGYDPWGESTRFLVNGASMNEPTGAHRTTIEIDTMQYREPSTSTLNSAYRIQVQVRHKVPVIFMRFAGFDRVECYASAVAENINDLDIVLVFDKSGSMEFDTLCYGCWESNGDLHPLPWNGPADGQPEHCDPIQPYRYNNRDYYFIEAEEYFYSSNPYERETYNKGYTYWVLQRRPNSASSRDGRGAYIMHMPYPDMQVSDGGGVTCRYEEIDPNGDGYVDYDAGEGMCWSGAPGGPYPAPWVSYNFSPVSDGNYYIWVRGQSANSWKRSGWPMYDTLGTRLFWGIQTDPNQPPRLGGGQTSSCGVGCEDGFYEGTGYDGASWRTADWQWRRLNDTGYYMDSNQQYMLIFWGGGAQFALDRIAITTEAYGNENNQSYIPYP
ncbi:MAG TPA: hypothetical protein ENN19_14405, partial [Chloroflexi bacterium]|nr:hypothetical protein [Chloroflexota bacterium]